MLLCLLISLICTITTAHVAEQEVNALLALYSNTNGTDWRWRGSAPIWNFTKDSDGRYINNPCSTTSTTSSSTGSILATWQGVTCSKSPVLCSTETCHITSIALSDYNLAGSIPCNISDLTALEVLDFYINSLTGSIPYEIGYLTSLKNINFRDNLLSGSIPPVIYDLLMLTRLYLAENFITGTIAYEVNNLLLLQRLYLFDNLLTSTIPEIIGNLVSLRKLMLDRNLLTGTQPRTLEKLVNLDDLRTYRNQLTGTVPQNIGSLTALTGLYIHENLLSGTHPSTLSQLTTLVDIRTYRNRLTGTIPVELGNLKQLRVLLLQSNKLVGSIPSSLGNILSLTTLDIQYNSLTGTIPNSIYELTFLLRLEVAHNQLSGTIDENIANLKHLTFLDFSNNLLTSSIPIGICNFSVLLWLDFSSNQLTGSIPSEIGDINVVEFIDFSRNALSSSIPFQMGKLRSLEMIFINVNFLTGFIPKEFEKLEMLTTLNMRDNILSGSIPTEIGNMFLLEELDIQYNDLSGLIPSELGTLVNLRNIFLQNNKLSGRIDNVFNYSNQLLLEVIDMSSNQLSAYSLESLYLIPSLRVLALSVNCFEDELTESMCAATQIEVLSLNGLGAGEGCKNAVTFPFSGVLLFNTIGGTIPACVWELRNLTVLHLAGNGLTGTVSPQLLHYSQLSDVSLTHNKLIGSIPVDIQKVQKLDLSYNRFSGKLRHGVAYVDDSSVNMGFNRLSGRISAQSFENNNITHLNILLGNMFSCRTIPNNDENSAFYICGSQDLDFALICLFSVLTLALIVVVAWVVLISSWVASFKSDFVSHFHNNAKQLWTYLTYIDNLKLIYPKRNPRLQNIIAMIDDFKIIIFYSLKLFAVIVIVNIPIYITRLSDSSNKYTTHADSYTWVLTVAYMKGVLPACLIAMSWIIIITLCYYHTTIRINNNDTSGEEKNLLLINSDQANHNSSNRLVRYDSSNIQRFLMVVSFLLNITLSTTVNALYVWAITKELSAAKLFIIQFSLAVFRLMYSKAALPLLSRSIKDRTAKIMFRLRMLLLNNFLIPCIVVVFTSPSCLKDLIVKEDVLSTPYEYEYCARASVSSSGNVCTQYAVYEASSASLSPPFTYSNQCSSALLTSYIPVLIVGRIIQIIFCFISPPILISIQKLIDVQKLVQIGFISGIIWPEHFVGNKYAEISHISGKVFNESDLYLSILNSALLMLTFGLCSPMLALALTFLLVLQSSVQLILIGRFASVVRSHTKNVEDLPLSFVALSSSYISLGGVLKQFFWSLAWSSSLFFSMFCWDIAASSEEGFIETLWIPIIVLSYPGILVFVARCKIDKYFICLFRDSSKRDRAETGVAFVTSLTSVRFQIISIVRR